MSLDINNLQNAQVQDSNYTNTGLVNARYNGSVSRPTFNPSGSDLFNSEKGDYPILKLIPVEGVIFEANFPDASIEDLIRNPIKVDQFELKTLFITTFSRQNNTQGLRQIERNRLRIELELQLPTPQGPGPAIQTFVFEEVEGRLKRIPTKKIFFVQQNKFGITDSVGKLQGATSKGFVPLANSTFTRAFIISPGQLNLTAACLSGGPTTVQIFMDPGITSLNSENLLDKTIYTTSSLEVGNEFDGEGKYFGISFSQNQTPTSFILMDETSTGLIIEVGSCDNLTLEDDIGLESGGSEVGSG